MGNKFKIEKNVPVPVAKPDFPFNDMEVGNSFHVEEKDASIDLVRRSIAAYCKRKGNQHKKFMCYKDKDHGGCRVWRVEDRTN